MAKRRILVVDSSPAMRETLCVLLGGTYDVRAAAPSDLPHVAKVDFDLVIAEAAAQNSPDLPGPTRLWLGDHADPASLPRRFTPTDLRRRVAEALEATAPTGPTDAPRDWRIERPFLDDRSRINAERARQTGLALHVVGEPGSGKHAVARAVFGGEPDWVCDEANPVPPLDRVGARSSILAIGVDRWPNGARRALSALLSSRAGQGLRVISTATEDLAELVDRDAFLPELFYQLTLLQVRLAPLRERPADIPEIARLLAAEIAANLGRPTPTFDEAATTRLSRYLWFGNLAELQAVLTRTIALADRPKLGLGDLRFDAEAGAPELPAPEAGEPPAPRAEQATGSNLKLIIHELAHELKNPLVTIKTFTQHCRRSLLESEPDAEEFADMTGRAVDQMDGTIENLLTFARMSRPTPREVPLGNLLGPIFANGSELPVDYTEPPPVTVRVDPEQVAYAVENLVRALARDTPPDTRVTARFDPPDSLLCRLPAGTVDTREKLKHLVAEGDEDEGEDMPLGIAIASAILQRNGAELRLGAEGEPKTAVIRFPLVENEEEVEVRRNGRSPNTDR